VWLFNRSKEQVKLQAHNVALNYGYPRLADQTHMAEMLVMLNELDEAFEKVLPCHFRTLENTDTIDVGHRRMDAHVVAAKNKKFE
jgi:hypothetical protein